MACKQFKIALFILICFPFLSFSQQSGKVEYGLKIGTDKNNDNQIYNHYQKIAHKGADKLTFVLEYNKKKSKFYLKEDLQNDDRDAIIACAVAKYFNPIYTDLAQNKKMSHNKGGGPFSKSKEFLITDSLYDGWELKNETKKIQGLTCYKAVGQTSHKEGDKTFSKNLIAWYCPELSNSFGPDGYGGLPGLILELQINDVLFGAKKINLKNQEYDIELPTKGKVINNEEYIKKIEKRLKK